MLKPIIAGIAGGSGSGKTTLAEALQKLTAGYGSIVLSQDDYYRGLPDGVTAADYNFDDPAALDLDRLASDLKALKAGRSIHRPVYDFEQHCRADTEQETNPAPLIIVEGLFLFVIPSLRNLFDLRFFVEVPADERLRRRLRRDVLNRNRSEAEIRSQWLQQVEPMYQQHAHPTRGYAHLVLDIPHGDGISYSEQVVAMWGMVEERIGCAASGMG